MRFVSNPLLGFKSKKMFQLVDMHMRFINLVRHSLQDEPDIFDFIDRFKYTGNISRRSFRLAHYDRTICQHAFTELYGLYTITSIIQPSYLTAPVLMLCHHMICLQVYTVFQNKLHSIKLQVCQGAPDFLRIIGSSNYRNR